MEFVVTDTVELLVLLVFEDELELVELDVLDEVVELV